MMASRRTRIKGIANIPQRRKPTTDAILPTADENAVKNEDSNESNLSEQVNVEVNANNVEVETKPELLVEPAIKVDEAKAVIRSQTPPREETKSTIPPAVSQPSFSRRRLIKPAISLKAINKSSTPNRSHSPTEEPKTPSSEPAVPENAVIGQECKELVVPNDANKIEEQAVKRGQIVDDQVTDKDKHEDRNVLGITKLPLLQNHTEPLQPQNEGLELTRPPPPTSPSKFMNRARIKAVPRLGQRRTSFSIGSASESEDESKKTYKRIRNDSVCSTVSSSALMIASPMPMVTTPVENSPRKKKTEFNTVIQRKCKRTEQSRKLAEARRDFQMKFNNGKPDRQKLTMIDLIFYNPTSSPMSQKRKRKDTETESILSRKDEEEEQQVDNPPEPEEPPQPEAERSDEENTVPAPQITIGANGEIVIDEKSLFIENKDLKRERESLKNSSLVDGDTFDSGYGVFKRFKRSKDWSKPETLRFYKALNTIGTDFTLMCELFPGRSRRELKMKFKKEERVNRTLIDRAVMQPIQFDISDLQRELEIQELEKLRQQQLKKDKQQCKEERKAAKEKPDVGDGTKRRRARVKREPAPATLVVVEKPNLRTRLQQGINGLLDSDSEDDTSSRQSEASSLSVVSVVTLPEQEQEVQEDVNENNNHVETKTETQKEVVAEGSSNEIVFVDAESVEVTNDDDDDLTQGSIILSTVKDADGKEMYNVFTINEKREKVPVEITPEILEVLIRSQKAVDGDDDDCDDSIVMPSDNTIDNIMADISLSNIHDQTISNVSMTTDCLILPFDDEEMKAATATGP